MPKSLYVYILKCSDNSFYTGVTNDLEKRIEEHNQGVSKSSYTFSRRPVELAWSQMVQGPNQAIALEKQLKGWSRKKKQALIDGAFDLLHELAENKRDRERLRSK